jgi:hypothetical protein
MSDQIHEYLDRVQDSLGGPERHLPKNSTVAALIQHGGLQILITPGRLVKRLHKLVKYSPEEQEVLRREVQARSAAKGDAAQGEVEEASRAAHEMKLNADRRAAGAAFELSQRAMLFFDKLCPGKYYGIPSPLISHLTFPYTGKTYTPASEMELENPNLPAVFTFVGQFVDHDLTFNALNLYDVQTNLTGQVEKVDGGDDKKVVENFASPFIDLDSVYGRCYPVNVSRDVMTNLLNKQGWDRIYDGCEFRLTELGKNAYDLPRYDVPDEPNRIGAAWIFDPRNDENQLILHIHLLVMRVHNKLMRKHLQEHPDDCPAGDTAEAKEKRRETIEAMRARVVRIWQSVLLNDYLPRLCEEDVLSTVRSSGYKFHYKPDTQGVFHLPHEFAIGFRMGHSMLRSMYKLNSGDPIPLFDNQSLMGKGDLRGGRPLTLSHVIDWDVFYPTDEMMASKSLKIDSHVTFPVFDLPESAIPDDIKTEGNLPKRNLDRSRAIELGCGEDVARCLGVADRLKAWEVEPDSARHFLYQQDVNVYTYEANGEVMLVDAEPFKGEKDTRFKTPLWYYILREAEVREDGLRLGPLGSTIMAEVIVQAIMNGPYPYVETTPGGKNYANEVLLAGKKGSQIKLRDLIDFVHES